MRPSHALRALIAGLGGVAIVLGIYSLVAVADPSGRPMYLRVLLSSSWIMGYATLALLIGWRGEADRGVLLAGLFLAVMATLSSLRRSGLTLGDSGLARIPMIAFGGLGYAVGVRFTQSFPVPLSRASLRALRRGTLRSALLWLPAALLDARLFWPFVVVVEVVQHGVFTAASAVWHVLVYAALASVYLWAGINVGSDETRRRAFWILEGVLVFLVLEAFWAIVFVATRSLDLPIPIGRFTDWLTVVEGWAALICFAIAIFFYGAFDSALVIRRTAVLSMLSGLALVLMVAAEELLAGQVEAVTGINTGGGAVLGGVLAALAFRPLSTRLDRLLERWGSKSEGVLEEAGGAGVASGPD